LGTTRCLSNLCQVVSWFYAFLPSGKQAYMVGIVAICWAIWLVINKVTFDGHIMRSSMEVVFIMCSFLPYWAGLETSQVQADPGDQETHEDR
jgi:hypothetical protein